MSVGDQDIYSRKLFKNCKVNSSSDFCILAYSIYFKYFEKLAKRIFPIMKIEIGNIKTSWETNACYSHEHAKHYTSSQLYDLMIGYRIVLDFFLTDEEVCKVYRMDETDSLGWKIWKELDCKYSWCKTQMDRKMYSESKEKNYVS